MNLDKNAPPFLYQELNSDVIAVSGRRVGYHSHRRSGLCFLFFFSFCLYSIGSGLSRVLTPAYPMKPSGFDSGVFASFLVMTAGCKCCSMEAVCLDCYRVMLSDVRGGEDDGGCVADACRGCGPMKRRFVFAAFLFGVRHRRNPIPLIQSLEVGFFGKGDGYEVSPLWMSSLREVGDQKLFSGVWISIW
ncbi:Uncharacterized protein Rs2_26604 [Raphanus sativus]|nr:Uncharacterized protein Rs2_26604 [Raphanus sativus]